jgi:hypothetical protein
MMIVNSTLLANLLTPWITVLEKLPFSELVRNFSRFMKSESPLPYSQETATCPYPKPAQSSPYPYIPLREDPALHYPLIYAQVVIPMFVIPMFVIPVFVMPMFVIPMLVIPVFVTALSFPFSYPSIC